MQAVVSDLSQVPEALRGEYVQQDGRYVLKIEGDHPAVSAAVSNANQQITELRGKVDGFRDTNVRLLKGLGASSIDDALARLEKLKEVDPDEYAALKEKAGRLEKRGVKSDEDLASLIAKEVGKAVQPLNQRLDESEKKRADAEAAVAREKLKGTLTQAGVKAGVAESALDDFLARAERTFKVVNGQVMAVDESGNPVFSSKRAGEGLSPAEYAAGLQKDAPHLFKQDVGAGSRGTTSKGGGPAPREVPQEAFSDNIEAIAKGEVTVPVPWAND